MSPDLLLTALLPSSGGNPPLQSSSSTTVSVNLLDLNDNDPTFLNLPFVAEVPEGLPIGSSVFRVGLHGRLLGLVPRAFRDIRNCNLF